MESYEDYKNKTILLFYNINDFINDVIQNENIKIKLKNNSILVLFFNLNNRIYFKQKDLIYNIKNKLSFNIFNQHEMNIFLHIIKNFNGDITWIDNISLKKYKVLIFNF